MKWKLGEYSDLRNVISVLFLRNHVDYNTELTSILLVCSVGYIYIHTYMYIYIYIYINP